MRSALSTGLHLLSWAGAIAVGLGLEIWGWAEAIDGTLLLGLLLIIVGPVAFFAVQRIIEALSSAVHPSSGSPPPR